MRDFILQLRTQGLKIWQQLDRRQQTAVVVVGLAALALLGFLVSWAGRTEYAVAYSGLQEADASAVVSKLKEAKIPYQLDNNGRTVSVPAAMVADVRLQMAGDGLPQGSGVGYEVFNQTNFGVTDFVQKVNYQRALEGELSRTINRISAVDQSRVHIVIPKASLYTEDQKDATASVVLKLKRGSRLGDSEVNGIANLISGSVEGLKPQNITIIDTDGHVLSEGPGGASHDTYRVSTTQLAAQHNYEQEAESRVQSMLAKVIGADKAAVRVSAEMNWDQYESNSETYAPAGTNGSVRSQHSIGENASPMGTSPGGVPGTDSNIPTYTEVTTSTNSSSYARTDVTTNYELSKTVEHTVRAPGSVKKLSVAVVLDGAAVPDQAQVDKINSVVSAAIGLDAKRGDVLTVASMPFEKSTLESDRKAMEEEKKWDQYLNIAKIAAMIIAPIILLLFLRRVLRGPRQKVEVVKQRGAIGVGGKPVIGELASEPVLELPPVPVLVEDPQKRMVREQVFALARNNPEVLAQLIQTWFEEDKRGYR